jgi:phospholipase/carboxylesterase
MVALGLLTTERPPAGGDFRGAPLLLLLHGWATYRGPLFELTQGFDARLGIVAAQAPVRMGPSAYRWFDFQRTPDSGPIIDDAEEERSLASLLTFVDALVAEKSPSRLYLLGHSQGGTMTLSVALRRPPKLVGCININGRLLQKRRLASESATLLSGLDFFCGHGSNNDIVPLALGRATRQWLAGMGAEMTSREYPIGHEITPEALADASAWLSAHLQDEAVATQASGAAATSTVEYA